MSSIDALLAGFGHALLHDVRGLAFTQFRKEDVVRHPLVARIVDAYEKRQQAT